MSRDSFDFMDDNRRQRSRFGDNESVRGNDSVRSDLVDLQLTYRNETPLAIAVSIPGKIEWIWIPKSLCEFQRGGRDLVTVTLSERMAKVKGLV